MSPTPIHAFPAHYCQTPWASNTYVQMARTLAAIHKTCLCVFTESNGVPWFRTQPMEEGQ